jgi:sucrose-6-phosphate hydrolase SacC (GH32 family)
MRRSRLLTRLAASAVLLAATSAAHGQADDGPRFLTVLTATGDSQAAPHGEGNIYAPDVLYEDGKYRMWFGAQGRDGHDRIHLAESADGVSWGQRGVVLEDDTANHVNDPSVVRVGDQYFMYYTRAGLDIRDEIAVATSPDGVRWTKRGIVLAPSPAGAWDSLLIGRPSVLVEGGLFRMWYDGRKDVPLGAPVGADVPRAANSSRVVGYAESHDGFTWTRPERAPVFAADAGGVHVSRVGDQYVMVYESHAGTFVAVSQDGRQWESRGLLAGLSGSEADQFGHVTPFLLYDREADAPWLFVGAARGGSWDRNAIARLAVPAERWRSLLR